MKKDIKTLSDLEENNYLYNLNNQLRSVINFVNIYLDELKVSLEESKDVDSLIKDDLIKEISDSKRSNEEILNSIN